MNNKYREIFTNRKLKQIYAKEFQTLKTKQKWREITEIGAICIIVVRRHLSKWRKKRCIQWLRMCVSVCVGRNAWNTCIFPFHFDNWRAEDVFRSCWYVKTTCFNVAATHKFQFIPGSWLRPSSSSWLLLLLFSSNNSHIKDHYPVEWDQEHTHARIHMRNIQQIE